MRFQIEEIIIEEPPYSLIVCDKNNIIDLIRFVTFENNN